MRKTSQAGNVYTAQTKENGQRRSNSDRERMIKDQPTKRFTLERISINGKCKVFRSPHVQKVHMEEAFKRNRKAEVNGII